jgi:prepilin-type N-terminal cleavage/methylation domain-containing protein
MTKNGFTLLEVMMTTLVLGVISLALAEFSYNSYKVSFEHSMQVENSEHTRIVNELIDNEVSKASYIYPANVPIYLTGGDNRTINTNTSIALLIPDDTEIDPPTYIFEAFYITKTSTGNYNLYMFKGASAIQWPKKNVDPTDNIPALNITTIEGSSTFVASDFTSDSNSVSYILSGDKSLTDTALLGETSGVTELDSNALIMGIKWDLNIKKNIVQTIKIESISKNVPRYF